MKSPYRVARAKYQEPGKEPPRTEGGTPCGAVALDERLTTAHPTSTGLGVSLRRTKEHPGPANDSDPGRVSPKPASATDAMSEYEPGFTTFEQTPTRLGVQYHWWKCSIVLSQCSVRLGRAYVITRIIAGAATRKARTSSPDVVRGVASLGGV